MPLFHSLKASDGQLRWSSPEQVAERLCNLFSKNKDKLFQEHFTMEQQNQWRLLLKDVRMTQLKSHLNLSLADEGVLSSDSLYRLLKVLELDGEAALSTRTVCDVQMEQSESVRQTEAHSSLPIDFCQALDRKRSLTITLAPSSFDEEEYVLYKRYQMAVHGDSESDCGRSQYRNFLVDTPLRAVEPGDGVPEPGFGSFHMQYRIDDRLVAVGVVDILPRCLSSKYLFWDPDFAPLALGKISALKEIEWVQKAHSECPALKYYYMGYYVHSCPKMRYKGAYAPSDLLCPESFVWVKLTEKVRQHLDAETYVVLSSIPGVECKGDLGLGADGRAPSPIESQSVLVSDARMSFGEYLSKFDQKKEQAIGVSRMFSTWTPIHQQRLEKIVRFLNNTLREWRTQAKHVANQLLYECEDFLSYI